MPSAENGALRGYRYYRTLIGIPVLEVVDPLVSKWPQQVAVGPPEVAETDGWHIVSPSSRRYLVTLAASTDEQ